MLFGSGSSYSIDIMKHVAEILFKDDIEVYELLHEEVSTGIEQALSDEGIEPTSGFSAIVSFLELKGIPSWKIEKFKKDLTKYLLSFNEEQLPYRYLEVPKAIQSVKNGIIAGLRRNGFNIIIPEENWTELLLSFAEYVREYTRGNSYDAKSNGIIPLLYKATEYYTKDIPSSVIRNLTSVGMNQEAEGADYDSSDFQTEEMFLKSDYDRFDLLASNIYNVSDFLFRHNNQIYYDLFSRYKFAKVEEYAERLNRDLLKAFKRVKVYSNVRAVDVNFSIKGGRSNEAEFYAMSKLRERNKILAELDAFIEGRADLSDLNQTIANILSINEEIVQRTKGKDKKAVFDTEEYISRDKLSNDEKLERLFLGVVALKKLIDYLRENHINVFSVSSAIFRDQRLIKRFTKFSRYMDLLQETKSLLDEEEMNQALLSNDDVYDDLIRGSANVINNIPLRSIKDVIDNRAEQTVKKDTVIESVLDKPILERAKRKYDSFFKSSAGLSGLYATHSVNVSKVLAFLLSNNIIISEGGKWKVNATESIESFLAKVYRSEETAKFLSILSKIGKNTVEEQYLSFFRSFEFIRVFLEFISDLLNLTYVTKKGYPVEIHSKFKLFMAINEDKELFNIPSMPINYTQFSHILDRYGFEYYLSENDADIQSINIYLIKIYKLMYKEFEEFLSYISDLAERVYADYTSGVSFSKSSGIPTGTLKTIGISLYQSPKLDFSDYPRFERFKYLSGVDEETGFIKKGKGLYYEEDSMGIRYLHETGYWVRFLDSRPETYPISVNDVFGG